MEKETRIQRLRGTVGFEFDGHITESIEEVKHGVEMELDRATGSIEVKSKKGSYFIIPPGSYKFAFFKTTERPATIGTPPEIRVTSYGQLQSPPAQAPKKQKKGA